MKKTLITGLMMVSMWVMPAFARDKASVEFQGNAAIIIDTDDEEYVIPMFNIVGINMDPDDKEYFIKYYGYYSESVRKAPINKATYEKVKRALIKVEQ